MATGTFRTPANTTILLAEAASTNANFPADGVEFSGEGTLSIDGTWGTAIAKLQRQGVDGWVDLPDGSFTSDSVVAVFNRMGDDRATGKIRLNISNISTTSLNASIET